LERIIRRAELEPWVKPFQNCRSTRETELAEEYPIHVVCAWIGNTQAVAAKHYLQVRDEDFERAAGRDADSDALPAQNPTQQPTGDPGTSWQETTQALGIQGLVPECATVCNDLHKCIAPRQGFEPWTRGLTVVWRRDIAGKTAFFPGKTVEFTSYDTGKDGSYVGYLATDTATFSL
jgi:hypothetical protein